MRAKTATHEKNRVVREDKHDRSLGQTGVFVRINTIFCEGKHGRRWGRTQSSLRANTVLREGEHGLPLRPTRLSVRAKTFVRGGENIRPWGRKRLSVMANRVVFDTKNGCREGPHSHPRGRKWSFVRANTVYGPYFTWIDCSNFCRQDGQEYEKVSNILFWKKYCIPYYNFIYWFQVPRVNNAFINILLKCRSAPSIKFYLNNTAGIPILQRNNQTL